MITLDDARARDAADPLRRYRAEFDLPDGVFYLDGNSLGPPPMRALERIAQTAEREWRRGLIRSWNDARWIDLPKIAGAKIAAIIGAAADEVIVCDSTSLNIFKLAGALIAQRPGAALCVDATEFPTDQYILEGLSRLSNAPLNRIDAGVTPTNAILVRSLVNYKTAAILDMRAEEEKARAMNCDIIWDLSHATGLAAFDVKQAGARYAVGCGYKYLNGGPGAPAFIYVARADAGALAQPLSGWMGDADPFSFNSAYQPADGAARFAAGTPPILSLSALDAALDLFDGLDMARVEAKARSLGDLFLENTAHLGFPPLAAPARRGGHLCLESANGRQIMQALIARGAIGDFRAPDLMRFGFSPLYLSYEDVWRAAEILTDVVRSEEWRRQEFSGRGKVT